MFTFQRRLSPGQLFYVYSLHIHSRFWTLCWPLVVVKQSPLFCDSSLIQLINYRIIAGRIIYTIICLKSVGVRRWQVAILARSPREMSLTDRILPRYILSRVRVSQFGLEFLYAKKTQTRLARMLDPLCGQINNWIGNCRTDPAGWRSAKASGY